MDRKHTLWIALFASAAVLYLLFIIRCTFVVGDTRGLTLFDDAMISMRYARNLVEHGELTWNSGDPHVEGYTNLLWTLWMAIVHMLPLSDLHLSFAVAITGAALLLATGRGALAIARALTISPAAHVVAAGAALFTYALAFWTLRGMEVGLLAWLATTGLVVLVRLTTSYARRDFIGLLACTAAALLTRTDAVVFVIGWLVYSATCLPHSYRRRVLVALVVVVAGTLVAHTLFRWLYYGALLPNTYYLKLEGISLGSRLYRGTCSLLHLLQGGWLVPCALAAFALLERDQRRLRLLLAAQVIACAAYSIYVGGDAWEEFGIPNRYLSPALPALFVLGGLGCVEVARSRRLSRAFVVVLCGLAAAQLVELFDPSVIQSLPRGDDPRMHDVLWILAFALAVFARPASAWLLGVTLVVATTAASWRTWWHDNAAHIAIDVDRVRHGLAIRDATSVDATLAATPCGSIPYFARRRTLDLLGKSDVTIAHQPPRTDHFHPGHVKWDYPYSIERMQPDLVDELFIPPLRSLVERDLAAMPAWGYREVLRHVFVHERTTRVNTELLVERLRYFGIRSE
jgi:hypothetical protein